MSAVSDRLLDHVLYMATVLHDGVIISQAMKTEEWSGSKGVRQAGYSSG